MANEELEKLVRDDIEAGLAGGAAVPGEVPREPIFAPVDRKSWRTGRLPNVETSTVDGNLTAVEWSYTCEHVGPFAGLRPTGKTVTIHGVTIVDPTRKKGFRRYVDWADVMAQLDVSATFRPSFTSVNDIPGFGEIVLDPEAKKGKRRPDLA